jgi:hypothetical protein
MLDPLAQTDMIRSLIDIYRFEGTAQCAATFFS